MRAVQRDAGFDGEFDGFAAQHRQRAGEPEADRADVRVRGRAKAGGASAEYFRARTELAVDFEADNRLVFRDQFGRRQVHSHNRHLPLKDNEADSADLSACVAARAGNVRGRRTRETAG